MIAGLSVAGLMLPEAVAYAGIAGLSPGRAIAAAIAAGLAYAVFGGSRFAVIAPTSSSAAILAAALATLAPTGLDRDVLATIIVLIVGMLFLLMAATKLGGVAAFISRPVLRGFAFGLAVTIIIKQLPTLMGLPVHAPNAMLLVIAIVSHIAHTNPFSLSIGGAALALLFVLRWQTRLPGALIVLGLSIGTSMIADLPAHGVRLVGPIVMALALPPVPAIGLGDVSRIAQLALPLTLILFAESWGTVQSLALRHGDTVRANRELGAIGAANILSALAQGMPVGAGFSAGSANEAAGATTRFAGAAAAVALGLTVLLAGPAVARIPEPVLAAIVIAALTHALQPEPILRLFRINRDQWVALAAASGVILFGVLNGMLIAVALSLATLLHRMATPAVSTLGRWQGGHSFVDLSQHGDAAAVAGITIYRPNAPLFFANASAVLGWVAAAAISAGHGTAVVLSLEESDDLDSTAVEALADLEKALTTHGMTLHLARVHDRARAVLIAAGMARLVHSAGFSVADTIDAIMASKGTNNA